MRLKDKFQNDLHIHIYDAPRFVNRIRLGGSWIYYRELACVASHLNSTIELVNDLFDRIEALEKEIADMRGDT